MEVNYQPKRNIQQLHVAQQLRLMDRQDFLNALKLQQQATLDKNVKSQRFLKYQPFILDFDEALIHGSDLAKLQFAHQTPFIDTLNQSRPFEAMHLYCGTNNRPAHLIGLLEKWMHPTPLHQANEENEEFCPAAYSYRAATCPLGVVRWLIETFRSFSRHNHPFWRGCGKKTLASYRQVLRTIIRYLEFLVPQRRRWRWVSL